MWDISNHEYHNLNAEETGGAMKTTICLEYIGQNKESEMFSYKKALNTISKGAGELVIGKIPSRKPWIAEITGTDPKYTFSRKFINSNWQRERENSAGSRGCYLYFILKNNHIYEIRSYVSWKTEDRYFARVTGEGKLVRLEKREVIEWLKNR